MIFTCAYISLSENRRENSVATSKVQCALFIATTVSSTFNE